MVYMQTSLTLSILFLSFFASITFNGLLRNIAKKRKILIDIPDKSRKFHIRSTPLTGGIGIFLGMITAAILLTGLTEGEYNFKFKDQGIISNISGNSNLVYKNFEVNNEDYKLSLISDTGSDKISVGIDPLSNKERNSKIDIEPISDNKFKVILSNGEYQIFIVQDNKVSEISPNNEKILNEYITKNTDDLRINVNDFAFYLYLFGFLILIFMILDDYYGLKAITRLFFQGSIAAAMIFFSGEYLVSLGNLFSSNEIILGAIGIPFTIFCVVGLMNAFNMIDGLNGICASFVLIPLVFLTFLGKFSYGLLIPIGALLGFLAYNLGYLGKKRGVFLGDSGSNLLGFMIAFICIEYSQNITHASYINPVTALWLVALPLLDCLGVMFSRSMNGIMPFRPGRDHLHHKLLDMGFKPKSILLIFISASIFLCGFGFLLQTLFSDSSYISFYIFVLFSLLFYLFTKKGKFKNA